MSLLPKTTSTSTVLLSGPSFMVDCLNKVKVGWVKSIFLVNIQYLTKYCVSSTGPEYTRSMLRSCMKVLDIPAGVNVMGQYFKKIGAENSS